MKSFYSIILVCFIFLTSAIELRAGLVDVFLAIENSSPELSAAQARLEAAKAAIALSSSQYWGRIELSTQDAHYNDPRPISRSLPVIADRDQFAYGAYFILPIDINGRITAQVTAREYFHDAARYGQDAVRLALFKQAATLYRGLQRLAGIKLALSKQQLALEKHRKITQTAINVGRMAPVNLLRINAEIENVKSQIAGVKSDEVRLRSAIAALLDQEIFDEEIEAFISNPTTHISAIADDAIEKRPDIIEALKAKEANKELLKDAKREWLSQLSIQANARKDRGYNSRAVDSQSVLATLSWELWDGGRRKANINKRNANLREVEDKFRSLKNRARAELASAKAAWSAGKSQYNSAKAGLVAAEETEHIQSDLYKNGRISAVDLIDVEAALFLARANLVSSLANWWLADDALHIAIGRPPSAYIPRND